MRYLTHEFAHPETLERARRWLVQAGFDPNQIEVMTEGIPRISVRVEGGEGAEASMIINAAERGDPQGAPSFWDIAQQEHVHSHAPAPAIPLPSDALAPRTFVVGFHAPEDRLEPADSETAIAMREAYEGRPGP